MTASSQRSQRILAYFTFAIGPFLPGRIVSPRTPVDNGKSLKPFPDRCMRLAFRLFVLFSACLLSGCVWLRLLETRNQLQEFDRNFKVVTTDHFLLQFLHPVLYSDDFRALTKMEPTRIEPLPKGSRWYVIFHKIDRAGKRNVPDRTLVFTLTFNAKSRLELWDFSPSFLAAAPPEFLEASLRSLGKGRILQDQRQLKVDPADLPRIQARLPDMKRVAEALGKPAQELDHEDGRLWVYRFQVDTPHVEEDYQDRRIALAKLYFDPHRRTLRKFSGKFVGLKLSIDYQQFLPPDHLVRSDSDD